MKTVVSTSDCNKQDNSESGSVHTIVNSNIMNLHGTVRLFSAYKNQIAKTNHCDYSGLSQGLFQAQCFLVCLLVAGRHLFNIKIKQLRYNMLNKENQAVSSLYAKLC